MEYWCHVLAGARDYYLDMLDNIQKQIHCATGPTFADSLVLQKVIVMWSVMVSSIGTLLEDAHIASLPSPPPLLAPLPLSIGVKFFMGEKTFLYF